MYIMSVGSVGSGVSDQPASQPASKQARKPSLCCVTLYSENVFAAGRAFRAEDFIWLPLYRSRECASRVRCSCS